MKIAFIGNYPPKACGIGTFTNSLARAILANTTAGAISEYAEIIAMEEPGEHHDYPGEVTRVLPTQDANAYRETAKYLNENDFDLVILQHEYGIFGGDDGSFILHLLDRLQLPLIVTFHTVLKEPSFGQRNTLHRIADHAQQVVVMSKLAARLLKDVFEVALEKIQIIEHGVPEIELAGREELRQKLGWTDRKVLFTFGLLGRSKGIETAIRSLPAIVAEHPDLLYVVLGKTHPNIVRDSGEEYREYLHDLADELGVGDNLEMISKFASEQDLFEHLRAADVYVIPYPNEAQITSGTLAYAVGAGAAIVSTPFWHATELLDEGRGRLFDFHNHRQLAETVLELLGNDAALKTMRARATEYGKDLVWPRIGGEYLSSCGRALANYQRHQATSERPEIPDLDLSHLIRLTDDCGIVQHGKYAIPNRYEGYCLDDNGRALLLTGMMTRHKLGDAKELARLADTYISYIYHAQNVDGTFRNFMSYDRRFLERVGSEDSYGRALWGVGYCLAYPPRTDHRPMLEEIFVRAIGHVKEMRSPRTVAYAVIGLSYYLEFKPGDESMLTLMDRLCSRLLDHFRDSTQDEWRWFERYLTYSNGILPYALFRALHHVNREDIAEAAAEATRFLAEQTIKNGVLSPIGCSQPFLHREERPQFDQQPVDVMGKVLLFSEACRHQELQPHCKDVNTAFDWFLGRNDLNAMVYNPETGGCYDGLTAYGVNQNQGAESLLSYLISRVEMEHFDRKCGELRSDNLGADAGAGESADGKAALKRLLNGYAKTAAPVNEALV